MLTRDQILSAPDPAPMKVHVKEWGDDVFVKVMSGAERAGWEAIAFDDDDKAVTRERFRATVVAKTVCDEAGNLLFGDEDIDALAQKPAPPIVRLSRIGMRINRLRGEDVDEETKN